jgi:HSP20 family protein
MTDTLTRYNPPSGLTRLSDAFDHLFRESFVFPSLLERLGDGFSSVTCDVHEADNAYIVQMALPGINPDKVEIRVLGHQMTIKGSYEIPSVEGAATLRKGLMTGEFSEVVSVPAEVEGDKAEATYKNGILTVTLPKAPHAEPKAIKVQVAQ